MDKDLKDLKEMARMRRRELDKEQTELFAKLTELEDEIKLIDNIDAILEDNRKVHAELEDVRQQLEEERRKNTDLEMKMAEMNKLTADVAKKSSEDGLIKALRTYVSNSKRKRPDKRGLAKEAALDMVLANKLTLPEDLASAIESLDDDQSEPKMVNVQGNYNDIHDNGTVNQK